MSRTVLVWDPIKGFANDLDPAASLSTLPGLQPPSTAPDTQAADGELRLVGNASVPGLQTPPPMETLSRPTSFQVPEPEPAPLQVQSERAPLQAQPEPAPLQVQPDPAPVHVQPEPAFLQVQPEPAPVHVQPGPEPAAPAFAKGPSTITPKRPYGVLVYAAFNGLTYGLLKNAPLAFGTACASPHTHLVFHWPESSFAPKLILQGTIARHMSTTYNPERRRDFYFEVAIPVSHIQEWKVEKPHTFDLPTSFRLPAADWITATAPGTLEKCLITFKTTSVLLLESAVPKLRDPAAEIRLRAFFHSLQNAQGPHQPITVEAVVQYELLGSDSNKYSVIDHFTSRINNGDYNIKPAGANSKESSNHTLHDGVTSKETEDDSARPMQIEQPARGPDFPKECPDVFQLPSELPQETMPVEQTVELCQPPPETQGAVDDQNVTVITEPAQAPAIVDNWGVPVEPKVELPQAPQETQGPVCGQDVMTTTEPAQAPNTVKDLEMPVEPNVEQLQPQETLVAETTTFKYGDACISDDHGDLDQFHHDQDNLDQDNLDHDNPQNLSALDAMAVPDPTPPSATVIVPGTTVTPDAMAVPDSTPPSATVSVPSTTVVPDVMAPPTIALTLEQLRAQNDELEEKITLIRMIVAKQNLLRNLQ